MHASSPKRHGREILLQFLPAVFVGLLSLGVAAATAIAPSDRAKVSVIFPPWWSARTSFVVASEAGYVIGQGAFPFIVAMRSDGKDLIPELKSRGAWFVVDGAPFLICGDLARARN